MKTRIFYFSATGNSLSTAKVIADGIGNTELLSIPSITDSKIMIDTQTTGLVFPVYAWGLPRMVEEFIEKLESKTTGGYFFAVATCAGTSGAVMLQLKERLLKKEIKLNAGFLIREPSHSPLKQVPVEKLVIWLARKTRPLSRNERIQEILNTVGKRENKNPETSSRLSCLLGTSILHKSIIQTFRSNDQYFSVDESCTKCGICTSVCPRNNLILENNGIKWNNDCELCFGCYNWCPQKSIHHQNEENSYKFVHHDDISLKEMKLR